MRFYIKREKYDVDAVAEYNPETKTFTVLKGSKVSSSTSKSIKFHGAKAVIKTRVGNINNDNILIRDIVFKSPSTAGNFVTGFSTNGCDAWKDVTGRSFRDIVNLD